MPLILFAKSLWGPMPAALPNHLPVTTLRTTALGDVESRAPEETRLLVTLQDALRLLRADNASLTDLDYTLVRALQLVEWSTRSNAHSICTGYRTFRQLPITLRLSWLKALPIF